MGVVDLVVLCRLLRATRKIKVVNFFEEKVNPQTKSWLRLCRRPLSNMFWCLRKYVPCYEVVTQVNFRFEFEDNVR